MSAEIIINGEKINLNGYFETLEIEKHLQLPQKKYFKLEFLDYSELGYLSRSILNVCRQALENENDQLANGLDYSRLLELAISLIPHAELGLLTKLHEQIKPTTK